MTTLRYLALLSTATMACAFGRLPAFTQASGSGGTVQSYFGYLAPGAEGDGTVDGKRIHRLWLWFPTHLDTLGVRMISPVGSAKPGPGDLTADDYEANALSKAFFDPWFRLVRCASALNPEDLADPCTQWIELGTGVDSDKLPPLPNGQRGNAEVNLVADQADIHKALTRGMYRVSYAAQSGSGDGTFLLQVGTDEALQGFAIATSQKELARQVE